MGENYGPESLEQRIMSLLRQVEPHHGPVRRYAIYSMEKLARDHPDAVEPVFDHAQVLLQTNDALPASAGRFLVSYFSNIAKFFDSVPTAAMDLAKIVPRYTDEFSLTGKLFENIDMFYDRLAPEEFSHFITNTTLYAKANIDKEYLVEYYPLLLQEFGVKRLDHFLSTISKDKVRYDIVNFENSKDLYVAVEPKTFEQIVELHNHLWHDDEREENKIALSDELSLIEQLDGRTHTKIRDFFITSKRMGGPLGVNLYKKSPQLIADHGLNGFFSLCNYISEWKTEDWPVAVLIDDFSSLAKKLSLPLAIRLGDLHDFKKSNRSLRYYDLYDFQLDEVISCVGKAGVIDWYTVKNNVCDSNHRRSLSEYRVQFYEMSAVMKSLSQELSRTQMQNFLSSLVPFSNRENNDLYYMFIDTKKYGYLYERIASRKELIDTYGAATYTRLVDFALSRAQCANKTAGLFSNYFKSGFDLVKAFKEHHDNPEHERFELSQFLGMIDIYTQKRPEMGPEIMRIHAGEYLQYGPGRLQEIVANLEEFDSVMDKPDRSPLSGWYWQVHSLVPVFTRVLQDLPSKAKRNFSPALDHLCNWSKNKRRDLNSTTIEPILRAVLPINNTHIARNFLYALWKHMDDLDEDQVRNLSVYVTEASRYSVAYPSKLASHAVKMYVGGELPIDSVKCFLKTTNELARQNWRVAGGYVEVIAKNPSLFNDGTFTDKLATLAVSDPSEAIALTQECGASYQWRKKIPYREDLIRGASMF